jgi:hypothetical protein
MEAGLFAEACRNLIDVAPEYRRQIGVDDGRSMPSVRT